MLQLQGKSQHGDSVLLGYHAAEGGLVCTEIADLYGNVVQVLHAKGELGELEWNNQGDKRCTCSRGDVYLYADNHGERYTRNVTAIGSPLNNASVGY